MQYPWVPEKSEESVNERKKKTQKNIRLFVSQFSEMDMIG